MSQSDDLGKSICQFMAEERAAGNATVTRPAILDAPRPADPVSAERWGRERELAEEGYITALLRKDACALNATELTYVGRFLVMALKEQQ